MAEKINLLTIFLFHQKSKKHDPNLEIYKRTDIRQKDYFTEKKELNLKKSRTLFYLLKFLCAQNVCEI